MGKHGVEVNITEHKERLSAPRRRITQVFRNFCTRRKSITIQEIEKDALSRHDCKGPSVLHNLLPIIDLLVIISPGLSSYEDRIIGRPRPQYAGAQHKLPADLNELIKWVERASESCDCDICAPSLYQARKSHRFLQTSSRNHRGDADRFYHARQTRGSPSPRMTLRLYGDYESMRLVRDHVEWLDTTYLRNTAAQQNLSVYQLKSLLEVWNPNLTGADMRQTMSRPQLLQLSGLLNQVFFSNAVPMHRESLSAGFSWLPETQQNCFGIGSYNSLLGTQILLHPTLYRGQNQHPFNHHKDLDLRWRNRLGTILHEMCHAFLKAYTCRACPSHDLCMGARGHGRAWQILAAKTEQVATMILDGFIDMGRYPSLLNELQATGRVPSRHDMQAYHFGTRWENAPP